MDAIWFLDDAESRLTDVIDGARVVGLFDLASRLADIRSQVRVARTILTHPMILTHPPVTATCVRSD